jgi:hypothetical protein
LRDFSTSLEEPSGEKRDTNKALVLTRLDTTGRVEVLRTDLVLSSDLTALNLIHFFLDTAMKPSSARLSDDPRRSAEPVFPIVVATAAALAAVSVQIETDVLLGFLADEVDWLLRRHLLWRADFRQLFPSDRTEGSRRPLICVVREALSLLRRTTLEDRSVPTDTNFSTRTIVVCPLSLNMHTERLATREF